MRRRTPAVRNPLYGLLLACLALSCSESKAPPERPPQVGDGTPTAFVNRVWRAKESTAVAPGTLYVFLTDGTLLVTSPHSTPLVGSWKLENGQFTMVEDGLSYPTDILESGPNLLRLRSHNPGEPVDMTLVPAEAGS
jgi:hypothetical protein